MKQSAADKNFNGMVASFIEPVVNNEASEYMTNHLGEIRNQVRKMGVDPDMIDDIVGDVWLSIHEAELRGEGYDISHSNDGDVIAVEEFIYGRIKRYSMNSKYHSNFVEKRSSKKSSVEVVCASCSDSSDLDSLDGFQKAYAMASSYDDIDDVEAEISLRNNIEFCMKFDSAIGFKFLNLMKNIAVFSEFGFNNSIFDKLKETISRNEALGEAFKEVMSVAISNRATFDIVVSSMA